MFLNDNQYFYVYLLGKMPIGTYTPPLANHYTKKKIIFFFILDVYCYKEVTKNVFL